MSARILGISTTALFVAAFILASMELTYGQTTDDSLTLGRVVNEVIGHNDQVAAARYMQEAAESRASSAGKWDDPMLMLSVENLPTSLDFKEDDMTMRVTGLSQAIPYSGFKGFEKKASRSDAQVAAAQLRTVQVDLAVAAKQAYYDLYYKQMNLADLIGQREFLEQIVSSSTAKLRTNQAGQDEVLTAQADLWRFESSVLSLQQQVDAARFNLNKLRGLDPNTPIPPLAAPALGDVPDSAMVWIEAAEQNYPELQRLNAQAESYRFSALAARRMQWPMLTIFGSYGFRDGISYRATSEHGAEPMVRDNMISFGANISLPIFSRGKQRQMARSMEAMQKGTLADSEQLRRNIQADIYTLHARALRLKQSLALYEGRILPATQDAYRSALAGYTANRTPFVSLLNAAVAVYRDRTTANDLHNDFARTLAEVERYTTDNAARITDSDAATKK